MAIFLNLRVAILRFLFIYNEKQERKQTPPAPNPAFTEVIPSPSSRGSVSLAFYTPPTFRQPNPHQPKHPLIIDFHGGGFTAGTPTLNARWIGALLSTPSAPVVVGVDYALAPEHPLPSAIQDAAAAIAWLAGDGAEKYGLDTERIVLVGFSAGGTLVFTSLLWMRGDGGDERESAEGMPLPHPLRGIVAVYPGLDYRIPRVPGGGLLARFMSATWDDAFFRRAPVESQFVSPVVAGDEMLREALPERIGLWPVAEDDLLGPCEEFRERLLGLGKRVTGDVEADARHAWDKYPVRKGDVARWRKREEWFGRMARDVEEMLRVEGEN